jgi:excinuclease ABC subunit C
MDLELELDAAAVMRWALERFYLGRDSGELGIPKELLVSVTPEDETSLELVLGAKAERRVQIRIPQRGDKRALMETVQKNAENALESYRLKRGNDFLARTDALVGLQHALGMKRAPLRIECFDISHLGGTGVVASMVVFEDGLPRKASYRKFNIQNPIDDTASIYEVTLRRLRQIADDPEGSIVPDLILVDGGEPQLHAAQKAAANYPNLQIPIASLAKRLEELWSGDSGYPILLPRASEELFLVQRIRDEAHRFAIAAQRAKRSSQIGTALMDISGLGESRSRALIRRFGSLARLKVATLEEIQDVPGIGRALAETIHGTLNP